jgi:hypothetical protein
VHAWSQPRKRVVLTAMTANKATDHRQDAAPTKGYAMGVGPPERATGRWHRRSALGTSVDAETAPPTVPVRGRLARGAAGVGFLVLAVAMRKSRLASAVAGWFGLSHVVAAVTGYYGCPERGAIPTLVAGRHVATGCSPWDRIDRAIGASNKV